MNSTINRKYKSMWMRYIKAVSPVLYSLFAILLFSGQALAVQTCKTASITASTPTSQFTDNGNGTVTDSKTHLMWKRCSEGQTWSGITCTGTATSYPWQTALQHAETLNNGGGFVGFTDWRMPNIKELNSIVEDQCKTPTINAALFPATTSDIYLSASPEAGNTGVWGVSFNNRLDFRFSTSANYYLRLVRAGP